MFRTNAFGQRINCMPRIRFIDPPEGGQTPQGGQTPPDLGFPAETPLDQMTVEQREAYWKHQARKHERIAKERADYDTLKTAAVELEQLKAANQTDAEKALAEAREEALREGEVLGAGRYLADAVKAKFQHLTGKSDEEVATAFAHVNAQSFTTDQGDIDGAALTAFAATFGATAGTQTPPFDPIRAAMEQQQQKPGATSGGSIREMTRLRADELQGKK